MFSGGRGVELFFVISGMVLGLPFARHYIAGTARRPSLPAYFLRRVTRLEPPYILNLLIRFPLIPAAKGVSVSVALAHLAASMFYLHGVLYGQWPLVHPPSWSLEIEVQFYLLAPVLGFLLFARGPVIRRSAFTAIILAGSVIQMLLPAIVPRAHLTIACYAQYFTLGLLLADLYVSVLPRLKVSLLWDLAAAPAWFGIFFVSWTWALPPMILMAYIAAFKGLASNWFFRRSTVTIIGGMCYSIYLTHSLALQALFLAFRKIHGLHGFMPHAIAAIVLITPALLACGGLFFVLVERPCMDKKWPQKVWARFHGQCPR
jgi:peptidoglycan/LPS O-acetylase OafA/YrhL